MDAGLKNNQVDMNNNYEMHACTFYIYICAYM